MPRSRRTTKKTDTGVTGGRLRPAALAMTAVAALSAAGLTTALTTPAHATSPTGGASGSVPAAAPAPQSGGTISGPFPVPYPSTTQKAGDVCAFALRYDTVTDDVKVIRYTNAQGRVTQEFYYGKLIGRFTNLSTGKSEVLDLSGDGVFSYFADGSSRITGVGPYSIGFHPGDHPANRELRLDGYSVVDIAADGTKTLRYASSSRNICTELS